MKGYSVGGMANRGYAHSAQFPVGAISYNPLGERAGAPFSLARSRCVAAKWAIYPTGALLRRRPVRDIEEPHLAQTGGRGDAAPVGFDREPHVLGRNAPEADGGVVDVARLARCSANNGDSHLLVPSFVSFIACRSGFRRHPIHFHVVKPVRRTRTALHFVTASSGVLLSANDRQKGRRRQAEAKRQK